MQTLLSVLVVLVLVAMYVTWTAGRLDRQHVRVEAGRSALDAALVRRAALAEELADAVRAVAPDAALSGVVAAARRARDAEAEDRERATPASHDPEVPALLGQLAAATSRIMLARNIANSAVDHTLSLRRRRVVRYLHLAGRAAAPTYFEIDDTTLADEAAPSARREP